MQDWSLCVSIGVDLGVEEPMILQAVRDPVPRLQSKAWMKHLRHSIFWNFSRFSVSLTKGGCQERPCVRFFLSQTTLALFLVRMRGHSHDFIGSCIAQSKAQSRESHIWNPCILIPQTCCTYITGTFSKFN